MTNTVKVKIGLVVAADGEAAAAVYYDNRSWDFIAEEIMQDSPRPWECHIINVEVPLPTIPEIAAKAEKVECGR